MEEHFKKLILAAGSNILGRAIKHTIAAENGGWGDLVLERVKTLPPVQAKDISVVPVAYHPGTKVNAIICTGWPMDDQRPCILVSPESIH